MAYTVQMSRNPVWTASGFIHIYLAWFWRYDYDECIYLVKMFCSALVSYVEWGLWLCMCKALVHLSPGLSKCCIDLESHIGLFAECVSGS